MIIKKKYIIYPMMLMFFLISNYLITENFNFRNQKYNLTFQFESNSNDTIQIFYNDKRSNESWKEENSLQSEYLLNDNANFKFSLPLNTQYIRLDLGNSKGIKILKDVKIELNGYIYNFEKNLLCDVNNQHDISNMEYRNERYYFESQGTDPYIVYYVNDKVFKKINTEYEKGNLIYKILLCLFVDIIIFNIFKKINIIYSLFMKLFSDRKIIWNLAKNDFKTKYAGSYLGIIWAFVQPVVTILLYWFVFEFGLRVGSPMENIPYILWFITGLVPWFFIQESISSSSNSLIEYSYLVKKIVFNIDVLPIIKIISAFLVHLVFLIFTCLLFILRDIDLNISMIQIIYYLLSSAVLIIGISYLTCSVSVFFKDLNQIIGILLQIFMWMTPILWSADILNGKLKLIAELNPLYYIIEGYRDSLLTGTFFWEKPILTIYFWCFSTTVLIIGVSTYKKLKPHLADIL